uniref:TIR-NBS-LRR type disease resistance protein n=1 Tax=Malus domestica TaxID=3750 RepID=R9RI98_MALDO|nr:TIR-NBS-LRR type disease resistance protein [Malus domestica]
MAASSYSDIRWKYDVFINFRGEDTYDSFISHLYGALLQKQINTFIDAEELRKGDRLPELLTAIQESRLSLVVFSRNYALSTCCLKELVEILECSYTKNQIVVPVFYQVDPATVRKLKNSFAEAFAQHDLDCNVEMEKVQSWRSALTTATNISGWDERNYKDDAELIEEIVEDVFTKLKQFSSTSSKYDVFISFRGEDTRRGFVSHLYKALCQKSINTYIDAKELRRGDPLTKLLIAARESKISLLILSENYASSTWSLKELVEIWKSKYTKNQIVLPIFYQVEPSDVGGLETSFAEAFAQHDLDSNAEVEVVRRWRLALRTTPHLGGWVSGDFRNDAKLIEKIVEDVSGKLIHISPMRSIHTGLVEMDSHVHEMLYLLNPDGVKTNDIRVVGIWGMGGIGKTAIARAVYDEIACRFDTCCFLGNVKEGFMKHGELHMQKKLLSGISGKKVGTSDILNKGFHEMLKRLCQMKKVLVVVDDVDQLAQIEALLEKQPDVVYRPKVLSDYEALELFGVYAFGTNQPNIEYDHLSRCFIQYAHGLPLALKVLGAYLRQRTIDEWKSVLHKLTVIPLREIHDVLKTSFDELDYIEKEIFLDIACFFKGMDKDYATAILDGCGFYPHMGIRVLIDRALITVSQLGNLEMPDLLVEMGREIVRQESIREPGRRSRLWNYKDVHHVLTQNTATEAVESIILDLSNSDNVCLNAEAFANMTRLRLLKIGHNHFGEQHLIGHLKFLFRELRCLSWHGFPLESLPSNCQFKNLVDIDMRYSLIERLWEGIKKLEKLKFIDLSYCLYLKETPDFTEMPNLEKLILLGCRSLVEVHSSFSTLTNLVLLNLSGCEKIKILAGSICMPSLKTLDLSGCSSLEMFPDTLEVMEELSELNLSGSKIKNLPLPIKNLHGLRILGLDD